MLSLKQRLLNYLEDLLGERPDLVEQTSTLPLFVRERHGIFSARLFGRKFLLALEAEGWETGSPAEYGRHREILASKLGEIVVLVLAMLPSYARNRMVQMGIPFMVPGSQIFIPNTFIDLREVFPLAYPRDRKTLSPAAQYTVLYHLLRASLAGIPLKQIAEKTHYSPMMMTKVKHELEALEISKSARNGRSIIINFAGKGRSLWDRVKPHMISPVKKTSWVRWEKPAKPALLAGMSALSRRTLIADDRLPTFALTLATFQELLDKGICVGCPDADSATTKIEIWSYRPDLLTDEPMVDPLSLYVSLRHSADERIQQQLDELVGGIKW